MTDGTRCDRCGSPLDAGVLFCSRCGNDVTAVLDPGATQRLGTGGSGDTLLGRSAMRQMLREATLGEYEILSELGRGGMASVYLAHDIALDRKVAIKLMAPHLLEGEGMAERFKLEARTAAKLSHPHIIPIYAVKETESTLFFVMKYVEGRGLDEIIKKSTVSLPIPVVTDVLVKVGAALGYAHRRGVVHRDVKPANIMIDQEGTPVVTDFGIAKVTASQGLTQDGGTLGTPTYMSPEQCEARTVTGASDQYSLAIVAFEMLTGRAPFSATNPMMTMYKHVHDPLPPLEDFRPDCPPGLAETIARMAAKDPADRYPSLEAAIQRLGNAGTDPTLDPVRSELMRLVQEGDHEQLLRHLTTDPSVRVSGGAKRSRGRAVAAIAGIALLSAGALAITGPWGSEAPPDTAGEASQSVAGQAGGQSGQPAQSPGGGAPVASSASDAGGTVDLGAADGGQPAAADGADAAGGAAQSSAATTANPTPSAGAATIDVVRIQGVPERIEPGETVRLTASAEDAGGSPVPGGLPRWESSDAAVARIASDGQVTAVSPGSVTVTASIGGVAARQTLTVAVAAAASVSISPADLSLSVGDRAALTVDARARTGDPVANPSTTWSSSNQDVAGVTEAGEITAEGPGQAVITATVGGVSSSATVTVTVATEVAIEQLVAAYARALESRDMGTVRAAYPGITAEQELQMSQALEAMEGLRAELDVESVDSQGDRATAVVSGTYRFVAGGRETDTPVSFTATFQRGPEGWRMTETR